MIDCNTVILTGRLTEDPDLRKTNNDKSVGGFRLAVNNQYLRNGEEVDDTVFVDVTTWGRTAENVNKFLKKGSRILVEGRLKLDSWEKDGQKRSKLYITAQSVSFLDYTKEEHSSPEHNHNNAPGSGSNAPGSGSDVFPEDEIPF